MKFRKLKKKLADYGILWDPTVGRGSHGAFVGLTRITKTREVHVLPQSQQEEIQAKYLNPLRRTFELTQEHGVSDDEFFS